MSKINEILEPPPHTHTQRNQRKMYQWRPKQIESGGGGGGGSLLKKGGVGGLLMVMPNF